MARPSDDSRARVGVVTVVYRSNDVLPGFIASLERASAEPTALVVVDNHPGPDSQAEQFASAAGGRYVALPGNPGYGGGMNAGVATLPASVDWILISNPDVVLHPGAIDVLVRSASSLPSPHSELIVAQLGGAVSRVPAAATAYPHRDSPFVVNVHGRWETSAEDVAGTRWARDVFRDLTPFASGGVYVNFLTADEVDRVRAAFGPAYDRLVTAKKTYDPENLFRTNPNVHA